MRIPPQGILNTASCQHLPKGLIGMGCEGMNEEHYGMAAKLFDAAERLGINYFDLYASDPGLRAAIGNALSGRRDRFIIQSHLCSIWKDGQYCRTRDLEETKQGFEEMLSLLQTDYIDVGMIHYLDKHGIDTVEQLNDRVMDVSSRIADLEKTRVILNAKKKRMRPMYDALSTVERLSDIPKLKEMGTDGIDDEMAEYTEAKDIVVYEEKLDSMDRVIHFERL